jgi:hypothetical protein
MIARRSSKLLYNALASLVKYKARRLENKLKGNRINKEHYLKSVSTYFTSWRELYAEYV